MLPLTDYYSTEAQYSCSIRPNAVLESIAPQKFDSRDRFKLSQSPKQSVVERLKMTASLVTQSVQCRQEMDY